MRPPHRRARLGVALLVAFAFRGCTAVGARGAETVARPPSGTNVPLVAGTSSRPRFFAEGSPWNTVIPPDARLHPSSAALVAHLARSSRWPWLGVSIHPWSVPVAWADAETPRVEVRAVLSNAGEHRTFSWPVPADARPAPESDGHLAVVDVDAGVAFDFFQARRAADGSYDCALCATVDLRGSGVRPPKGGGAPWFASHGARACGFPLVAGLVTAAELARGEIPHALVLAYPGIRQRWFVPPASTGHPANGRISEREGIPCGGRVRLDPTLDLDALPLDAAGRTLARALQRYGAYVGDFSESINVYADGSDAARAAFAGQLATESLAVIPLERLEVLDLGTLLPDG